MRGCIAKLAEMDTGRCGSCRFWVPMSDGNGSGQCRRMPPFGHRSAVKIEAEFPLTPAVTWCGEFAAAPLADPPAPVAPVAPVAVRVVKRARKTAQAHTR
jgi:hypothetical protein